MMADRSSAIREACTRCGRKSLGRDCNCCSRLVLYFGRAKQDFFIAACASLVVSGCFCPRGTPRYSFRLYGDLVSGLRGGGDVAIVWGGRSDEWVISADQARVSFADAHVSLGEHELLEFYDGPFPLNLDGVVSRGVGEPGLDCPHDEVDYDLTMLVSGEYTMVHRRSSAPEGFEAYYGDVTWMSWEGEDALVTTIVRLP
jgi:hypothetical protein